MSLSDVKYRRCQKLRSCLSSASDNEMLRSSLWTDGSFEGNEGNCVPGAKPPMAQTIYRGITVTGNPCRSTTPFITSKNQLPLSLFILQIKLILI